MKSYKEFLTERPIVVGPTQIRHSYQIERTGKPRVFVKMANGIGVQVEFAGPKAVTSFVKTIKGNPELDDEDLKKTTKAIVAGVVEVANMKSMKKVSLKLEGTPFWELFNVLIEKELKRNDLANRRINIVK